ncbi:MAG: HD domain-containing phosphohydrolase [bacterium]|nr:HD domain-containing phosphohydrolase [bacterium]
MNGNFDNVLKGMQMGLWRVRVNIKTGEHIAEFNDYANEMLHLPEELDGAQLFEYWRSHIDSDYQSDIDNFFSRIMDEGLETEVQYIWNPTGERELFMRIKGKTEERAEDYVVLSGVIDDITGTAGSWGVSYINRQENEKLTYDLQRQNSEIIEALGTIVEFRNMESVSHVRCVKIFSEILAKYISDNYPEYGITNRIAKIIANASPLHDVGKIEIADMILLKPGRLTRAEFDMMKKHSELGVEIIDSLTMLDDTYKRYCREIVLYHHERYDGRGYPMGLSGDEIPMSAQIVALADVYDALITPRIYKDAYTPKQAYNMIIRGECGEFNPKLIHAFKEVREELEVIAEKYKK